MMNIKSFIKDRSSYGFIYFLNTLLIILIMNLTHILNDRVLPRENILYAFIVSGALFCMFLTFEYIRFNPFYKALNKIIDSDDLKALLNLSEVLNNEQQLFKQVFSKAYRLYENHLSKYQENKKMFTIFINQWVHQMKTPVSVINLLLQEEGQGEKNEIYESIIEETQKLSHGLDIMLSNARLNQFNLDFKVEPVDLIALARGVVNDHKKTLIKYSLYPKILGDAEEIVETDKKWIRFVINQILINAIKYSRSPEKNPRAITIEVSGDPAKVLLTITDEGVGIPKEDISRVFEAFFTGKNGRETAESTGMGMYLSKRVCDELGHKLFLQSQEGEGTSFSILFYRGKNLFRLTNL